MISRFTWKKLHVTKNYISIIVLDNWEDSQEGESHVLDEDAAEGWEEFEPELIDLSDGRPYGTILITSETYGAVKSASYCLVGAEKVYEITLKTWKNEQLIRLPVGETYLTYFERKIAELPYYNTHKLRENGICGFEVFLSYGQGELPLDFFMEDWKRKSMDFLKDVFGKENVAAATLHMDEHTPHIHAIVFPIADGRLRARAFLPDRQAMRDLHTKYHEYTRECGLESENRYMHIEHSKVGKFYANINLALEKELPGPKEGESLEAYASRANEFYKEQMLRSLGKEQRIRQLEKEKDALEKANQTMEEKERRRYESQKKEIQKEIGSVQNARHAIHYRDSLQKAIEWKRESNPELAASVEQLIANLQQGYEKERKVRLDGTEKEKS